MIVQTLDIGLAALVLTLAAWTVLAPAAFPAVVSYVTYGLLLSLIWVRLFAVDVALTEAAIGGGLTGVLLIAAASKRRESAAPATERDVYANTGALGDRCALRTYYIGFGDSRRLAPGPITEPRPASGAKHCRDWAR